MEIKARRIDKAVQVSADMFLSSGIEAVKMTDIAEASNIGVASLYRYFGTKTGITIAAMTYLWNKLKDMFSGVFDSEVFRRQTGIKQIRDFMKIFVVLYEAHPDFMKLLSEFDLYIIKENIPEYELEDYEKSIINFYPHVEAAYKAGIADGTVREVGDFKLYYVTFCHALMEMGKKLVQGELLPNDDFSVAVNELELIIDAAINYIKK